MTVLPKTSDGPFLTDDITRVYAERETLGSHIQRIVRLEAGQGEQRDLSPSKIQKQLMSLMKKSRFVQKLTEVKGEGEESESH